MVASDFRNIANTKALWGQNLNQTKTKTILGETKKFSTFLLPKTMDSIHGISQEVISLLFPLLPTALDFTIGK